MEALFISLRLAFSLYLFVAPFIFIWLQQSLFKSSFDDALGNRLIVRLYVITVIGILGLFFLTLEWQYCHSVGGCLGCPIQN